MSNNQASKAKELYRKANKYCSNPRIIKGKYYNCGSRLVSVCPHCAYLYRGDWLVINYSGCLSGKNLPAEALEGYIFYFLTLTAPSFGAVHYVPKDHDKLKICGCGKTHTPEDLGFKGVPLDPDSYDYAGQVAWNKSAASLWGNTYRALREKYPSLDFFKVWEWQARGALHLHAVLRVKQSEGTKPEKITEIALNQHSHGHGWGEKSLCEPVKDSTEREKRTKYTGKYVSYSAKSWGQFLISQQYDPTLINEHYRRLDKAAKELVCPKCVEGVTCTAACHANFGATSRVISNSRKSKDTPGWSLNGTNRKVLKQKRYNLYTSNYDRDDTKIGMARAKKARQALANLSSSPQDIAARFANITARYFKPGTTRPGTRNHRSKPSLAGLLAPF